MKEIKTTPKIPDMITLCNFNDNGKTCVDPVFIISLHDIPKDENWARRTRVDMTSTRDSPGASFLVKETAVYIRTAMDGRRLRHEREEEKQKAVKSVKSVTEKEE